MVRPTPCFSPRACEAKDKKILCLRSTSHIASLGILLPFRRWIMLLRQLLIRLFAIAALLYGIHIVARQYAFESFLDGRQISFDDFPNEYAKTLNDSVSRGEQPVNFEYPFTFPDTKIPRIIHYIWFKNIYPSREGMAQIPIVSSRKLGLGSSYPAKRYNFFNSTVKSLL